MATSTNLDSQLRTPPSFKAEDSQDNPSSRDNRTKETHYSKDNKLSSILTFKENPR